MRDRELVEHYLEARYSCEAARQALRGTPAAQRLQGALAGLCRELREALGGAAVPRPFPRELLGLPPGERLERCRRAAQRLAAEGSTAAMEILDALEGGGKA